MKVLGVFLSLLVALPCFGQWKHNGNTHETIAFYPRDTTLFVSEDQGLYRIYTSGGIQGAKTGLDFSHANYTTFVSLGQYFFTGSYRDWDGEDPADNGFCAVSSDNGNSWATVTGGPIGTNGTYIFARYAYNVERSRDTGKTWERMDSIPGGIDPVGNGALVYVSSTLHFRGTPQEGVWRSLDSGTTWTHLQAPFSGPLVMMGTLLFAYQPYHYNITDPRYPPHNGMLIVSRDSGVTWDTVPVMKDGEPQFVSNVASYGHTLFVGGHSSITGYGTGVLTSNDSGRTWKAASEGLGDQLHIKAFGFFDTLAYMSASRDDETFPFGTYTRPLRELIDTTHSVVREHPPLAYDSIYVYPNPASGMVSIESGGAQVLSVSVLNLLGEEMHAAVSTDRVDLSHLPSGTYFLRIATQKGIVMRKIVRE